MKKFLCIVIAYLIGSLSPAALIGKIKHKNLREEGTRNLGATNTTLVIGKSYGFLVMLFDVFKGFFAVRIAAKIAPEADWLPMLAGFFAIIGHCFPFYLKFKGGKGLAAFGGVLLAYSPLLFLFEFVTGIVLMLIANSGTALTYYTALTFPIFAALAGGGIPTILICIAISLFLMIKFLPNLKKAIRGEEYKSRDFLRQNFEKTDDAPDL